MKDQPERVMVAWVPTLDDSSEDHERLWAQAIQAIEEQVPGVEDLHIGWCAMRARGAARYYGSEAAAAEAVVATATRLGFADVRVGVASGRFAAEQAVRESSTSVYIVTAEDTEQFLRPLPVSRAADEELSAVLRNLGIHTLGELSALPQHAVRERFGKAGVTAHRRARGLSAPLTAEVRPRTPPIDFTVRFACEPPLDGADQLAFACTMHAERMLHTLITQGLVCTELHVILTDDVGISHERRWTHPERFSAADVVNRVRWQATTVTRDPERGGAGIAEVVLAPVRTARAAEHEPGLWSTAPDERVHHHLSRVQSLVGHHGIGTGEITGGRLSSDRQRVVPWGSAWQDSSERPRAGPWPGHVPGAVPTAVYAEPPSAALLGRDGAEITVNSETGNDWPTLTALPAQLRVGQRVFPAPIRAWSPLWPLRERWWVALTRPPDTAQLEHTNVRATYYRLQLLLSDGDAWLLRHEPHRGWVAEARYS